MNRLLPRRDYQLVGIDTSTAHLRFAQSACVSFTRGTRITLATGAQRPVEGLRPGDRVLTRDDGVQPLRWIGRSTLRAEGDLAPIRIAAGTLNNVRDLLLSPGHGLFVYQRSDRLGVGRAEVLVRARDLVNGSTVVRSKGGFVDYFQLLFDRHQIIFAEGIAAESTLIDLHTSPALQGVMEGRIDDPPPFHDRARHTGAEIGAGLLDRRNAADQLRRASTG
ncbi:Hint domain-containing protein [Marimonas sp. MJW-29]|uniref:Hint domain-containing protein n=1 Tax=Sulfitobacter sediminis TaxID=3234186 RepID=A0ABV3RTX1_9RHOB